MIRNLFSRDSARTFDVLIVGAGATGALVALRMAENGLKVAILEAGPRFSGHTALAERGGERGQDHVVRASQIRRLGLRDSEGRNGRGRRHFALAGRRAAISSRRFPHLLDRRRRCGLANRLRRSAAALRRRSNASSAWRASAGHSRRNPTRLPMPPHRMNWHAQVLRAGRRSSVRIHSPRPSPSTRSSATAARRASPAAGAGRVALPKQRRPPPTLIWQEPSGSVRASSARRSFIA